MKSILKLIQFFLIYLFILGALQSQNAIILNKSVKFRAVNRDLSNVLYDLSKKSKVNIAFNIIDIPEKSITIYSPNYSLKVILDYILRDTGLKYDALKSQIVVYKPKDKKSISKTISGYILDEKSGEKLVYANVYLQDYSKGTISNEYGFYSLEISDSDNEIVFSYLGYFPKKVEINKLKKGEISIGLQPKPETILNEVVVISEKLRNKRLEFFSPENIEIYRIKSIAHLLGENDVFRYLYTKSGVLTGADGVGGMHVRGNNSGSNKILLDGVPVYNAQHAIGLVSIFNSNVIKSTKFIKTAFPAKYSGVLGSVVDIKTRDGNRKVFSGELDVGLLSVKGSVEGPFAKGNGSFLLSFRRSYVDLWRKEISSFLSTEIKKQDFSYLFFDLNFKINYRINKANSLFFSYYSGKDLFENEIKYFQTPQKNTILTMNSNKWNWGNSLYSLQWNSQSSNKLFVHSSIYLSEFELSSHSFSNNIIDEVTKRYLFNGNTINSNVRDIGFNTDFDYSMKNNDIKWGGSIINHRLTPMVYFKSNLNNNGRDYPTDKEIRDDVENYSSSSYVIRIYFENNMKFGVKTTLKIGLNLANFSVKEKNYYSIEPRIIFNQILSKKMVLSMSMTRMSQFVHTLSNGGLGLPTEVLLPTTKYLKPESIWHLNTGILYDINKSLSLSIQGYYNFAKNLIEHKDGSTFIVSKKSSWENYIPAGNGRMRGIESELKYSANRINFALNYTYSLTERKHENINNGKYYTYRFSRKHFINFTSVFNISNRLSLFLTSVYGSGSYYTVPTQLTPDKELVFEKKNNYQLPYYHRVDIGLKSKLSMKKISQQIDLGVYNVLSRKNPFYLIYKSDKGALLQDNLKEIYVFPIMPYISYKIKI